jgi:hypothetical protein
MMAQSAQKAGATDAAREYGDFHGSNAIPLGEGVAPECRVGDD